MSGLVIIHLASLNLSQGAAGSFGIDAAATPFLNELVSIKLVPAQAHFIFQLSGWILTIVSLPLAFLVIRTIKETNYEDEQVSIRIYFSGYICLLLSRPPPSMASKQAGLKWFREKGSEQIPKEWTLEGKSSLSFGCIFT